MVNMKKRHSMDFPAHCFVLAGSIIFGSVSPLLAQNAKGADSASVNIKALVVTGEWGSKQGLRLEGSAQQPARIIHPQLDVAAPKIEVSFDNQRQFTRVTTTGGVNFAVTLPQKSGPATRIQAKSDSATLERPTTGTNAGARVLTLRGGVDGWYQLEGGIRNALRGQSITLTSRPGANEALLANVEGGPEGVRLEVPPAAGGTGTAATNRAPVVITAQNATIRQQNNNVNADVEGGTRGVRMEIPSIGTAAGAAGELLQGTIVVTSQRATVRQNEGMARFIGNARAVSTGSTQKFDVAANEILLARNAKGDFDVVKTTGRTMLKLDLPQAKPAAANAAATQDASANLRPEYLEVEADSAEAQLGRNQLVFEGNVRGFYRVPMQNVKPNPPSAAAQTDYNFVGHRVVLSYTPGVDDPAKAWNFDFRGQEGRPVEIQAPAFRLDDF